MASELASSSSDLIEGMIEAVTDLGFEAILNIVIILVVFGVLAWFLGKLTRW